MKQNLEAVVNAIVNEDVETAKAAFHDYLRAKTQSIFLGEAGEYEEESDDDDDDESDDDDDDSEDKKPPFAKKDKGDDKDDDKDGKKKVTEAEGKSLGLFNAESNRARKAKNGPTSPIAKKKVSVGKMPLGADNQKVPKPVKVNKGNY